MIRWRCQSSIWRQSLPISHAMLEIATLSQFRKVFSRQHPYPCFAAETNGRMRSIRKIFREKCNKTLAYAQISACIYSTPPLAQHRQAPIQGPARRPGKVCVFSYWNRHFYTYSGRKGLIWINGLNLARYKKIDHRKLFSFPVLC